MFCQHDLIQISATTDVMYYFNFGGHPALVFYEAAPFGVGHLNRPRLVPLHPHAPRGALILGDRAGDGTGLVDLSWPTS